ncbi:MAG: GspE/PulE family protein [Planctomycetota bacterium]
MSVNEALVLHLSNVSEVDAIELFKMFEECGTVERDFFARLVEGKHLSEEQCYRVWAEVLELKFHSLNERELDPINLHRLPLQLANRYGAIVVDEGDDWIEIVIFQPLDILAIDALTRHTQKNVVPVISTPSAIQRALERQEKGKAGIEGFLARLDSETYRRQVLQDTEELKRITGEDAVVQLVNYVIEEALRLRASDIHLEPMKDELRLRYRIDGELEPVHHFPMNLHAPLVSRIKVMSSLDISEKRRPLDGRFITGGESSQVELRVSVLPTIHGEKVVLRILDKEAILLDLDSIGFLSGNLRLFRRGIRSSDGLVLLTGPTGSGKTTTLYSAISEINRDSINIVTVEDPVEYELRGTAQVQVDIKAGRVFSDTLRFILRQDPDVVMVGEVRDAETASIAIQAALTGHLVFSTLHTNDAPGAIFRLIDMGVDPYLLGPALRCVVAQRLLPRICAECRRAHVPDPGVLQALEWPEDLDRSRIMTAAGCKRCRQRGRHGRIAIHEVLYLDRPLQSAVASSADDRSFAELLTRSGYRPLVHDGLAKASQGIIAPEDLLGAVRAD